MAWSRVVQAALTSTPVGDVGRTWAATEAFLERFREGFRAYQSGSWPAARSVLEECCQVRNPGLEQGTDARPLPCSELSPSICGHDAETRHCVCSIPCLTVGCVLWSDAAQCRWRATGRWTLQHAAGVHGEARLRGAARLAWVPGAHGKVTAHRIRRVRHQTRRPAAARWIDVLSLTAGDQLMLSASTRQPGKAPVPGPCCSADICSKLSDNRWPCARMVDVQNV